MLENQQLKSSVGFIFPHKLWLSKTTAVCFYLIFVFGCLWRKERKLCVVLHDLSKHFHPDFMEHMNFASNCLERFHTETLWLSFTLMLIGFGWLIVLKLVLSMHSMSTGILHIQIIPQYSSSFYMPFFSHLNSCSLHQSQIFFYVVSSQSKFKGIIDIKMKILINFQFTHVVPNLFFFLFWWTKKKILYKIMITLDGPL